MAYNYFPTGYQPYMPQFQPYQQTQPIQTPPQQMTPPTIHAEIVQVEGEQEAKNYPVAAGGTQMMMSKDDENIFIKTAYANAPAQRIVYKKCEPIQEPTIDTSTFITREEFEKRINEITRHNPNTNNRQKEDKRNG